MTSKRISIPQRVTVRDAVALQTTFAPLVSKQSDLPERIRRVAGADGTYIGHKAVGAAVLIDHDSLESIETASSSVRLSFPYVPGLLAFREAPAVTRAIRKLKHKPDVCIVDGHGLAHPRRFGLACHVGLILSIPTIGVAKSRLFGREVGERIVDMEGNTIAVVLRIGRKNLYVSIGHKISLEDATRIVKHCISERGLEPLLMAHQEANRLKWLLKS